MNVWVDQDLCTGDGLCEEVCPDVFVLHDGLSYVREAGSPARRIGGPADAVPVPDQHLDAVLDAAEECPGECIFIEA
jgi:ferredoxin